MRRALEATELTDLGINFYFFGGSGSTRAGDNALDCIPVKHKLHDQEFLYAAHIVLLEDGEVVQIAFLFLGLLGEDVAVVSVLPLDLSRSGKRETLFGTGVGFELCHC